MYVCVPTRCMFFVILSINNTLFKNTRLAIFTYMCTSRQYHLSSAESGGCADLLYQGAYLNLPTFHSSSIFAVWQRSP